MQRKTLLVTGGAGYIGSHTAWLMAKQGYQVVILDRMVYGQQPTYPWATIIPGDIGDKALLHSIFSSYTIDAVMHFAAFIEVGASVADPRLFYENNVVKTLVLLESMLKHRVQNIIFSSSCAVYGKPQHMPMDENHPKEPISPYGKTKLMVEEILHDFGNAYDLNHVSLRYFNAAGAQPEEGLGELHEPETHLIPLLLRAMYEQKPFTIFGVDYDTPDGTCIRDYVHVSDIAFAHSLALMHVQQKKPSDQFNLGTGRGFSVKQLVQTAQKVCNMPVKLLYGKRRAGDPAQLTAYPAKAQSILGWQPRCSQLEHIIHSAHTFSQQLRRQQEFMQQQV